MTRRAGAIVALCAIALLVLAAPAGAKSYTLPEATVHIRVASDGSLHVTEEITYQFDGSFSGAYREIPLRWDEHIAGFSVSENGSEYSPGAPTEIGSSGAPDSYGWALTGEGVRIVWHYRAFSERRTFKIEYSLTNFTTVYNDVADVNIKVWGDEWVVPVEDLRASLELPGRSKKTRVWGHVAHPPLEGGVSLNPDGTGASLVAEDVGAGNWVEMRVVFPSDMLGGSLEAKRIAAEGLPSILAEERRFAQQYSDQLRIAKRDEERIDWILSNLGLVALGTVAAASIPAGLAGTWIWRRYGREPPAPETSEHIMEPPGDEPPALIAALLEPGNQKVVGEAFAATLFDLIRRGAIDSMSTMTEKRTWGGLRREDMSDLVLILKPDGRRGLEDFELDVYEAVVVAAKGHEHFHLSDFEGEIKEAPTHFHEVFTDFRKHVMGHIESRGWWIKEGQRPVAITFVLAIVAAITFGVLARATYTGGFGIPWKTIVFGALCALSIGNAIVMAGFWFYRKGWERRSPQAAEAASGWIAFRRFLTDFEGIGEATPGSVAIWEQYLCYGIAFGVADRVLAAAQLHAPPELTRQSSVYYIDAHGSPGTGLSGFAIHGIASAIQSASPPSSSGGGGGFSGSGGGGGGGGGGGAW